MLARLVVSGLVLVAAAPAVADAASVPLPTVPISIGMTPASPRAGSEVQLTGGAGAPAYEWDLDGDGQFDDATGLKVTTTFTAGTRTVQARAMTGLGVLTDSRTFTVHDWNVAPGGTVRATPHSARVGVPVKVEAKGGDADGLRVQTALDLDGDGSFETAAGTGTATFATPGERVIRARFTDDAGATSVATTTLDVHTGNLAPTAEIQPPRAYAATAAAAPSGWTVDAEDPDGEVVRYEFDLDGDGTYETDQGRDNRVPASAMARDVVAVRVTDDSGAVAYEHASTYWTAGLPRVIQVGAPTTLALPTYVTAATWDTDGDGAFDDGTGNRISVTFPSTGTYDVRVSGEVFGQPRVIVDSVSVREATGIAVPESRWEASSPTRANVSALLPFFVSGAGDIDASVDLDGDGVFGDTPANGASAVRRVFSGPTTIALRAQDARGRAAVNTTQIPFVPGDLGPDAAMLTTDIQTPLQAGYRRWSLLLESSDPDDGPECCLSRAWDADNDGEYGDGEHLASTNGDSRVPASFGLRVTDSAGVSTTLRRTVAATAPALPRSEPRVHVLRLSVKRPRLATLLRRGLTVDVACGTPGCRTRLVAKVDAKTARKVKLRSRTVASRTVSGTRRATIKLAPKAGRALKRVRSLKLTLTATATAAGARATQTKTLTIRR